MFLPCYNNETLRTMNHTHAMNKCTEKLHDECRTSPIKIIKTIRTRFSNVKQLLEILPDLKIIHVIRDPRATLFSQSLLQLHSHVQICSENNNGRARCSGRLCERLSSDLQEKELLAKMFPGRIMTVKYEDLARDPIETSQNMYDFIDVEMTSRTKLFIYQKTMAGSKSDCSICSTRSNSSAHVDRWKQAMDKEFIDIVNRKCKSVLKRQGYEVWYSLLIVKTFFETYIYFKMSKSGDLKTAYKLQIYKMYRNFRILSFIETQSMNTINWIINIHTIQKPYEHGGRA